MGVGQLGRQMIASRQDFNAATAILRREIIAVFDEGTAVLSALGRGNLTRALVQQCAARLRAAGRRMVAAVTAIQRMQRNANALQQVALIFFGANGPGYDILRAAGINPTVAIAGLNRVLPNYLAGCNRELTRLRNMHASLEEMLRDM